MRINKAGLTETVVVITAASVPCAPIRDNTFACRQLNRQSSTGDANHEIRWRRHEHV